jgi:phosphate transport system permease protein
MARAIGETAPIITIGALTFIAFLPPSPVKAEPPFLSFEWLFSPFTVMPIQMFNWTSRPEAAFLTNAAAAGFVLVFMTLAIERACDLAPVPSAQEDQVVRRWRTQGERRR